MTSTASSHITLKPAVFDGQPLKVNKPQGGRLASEGEPIVLTSYWRRRLADGDVLVVTNSSTPTSETASATETTGTAKSKS